MSSQTAHDSQVDESTPPTAATTPRDTRRYAAFATVALVLPLVAVQAALRIAEPFASQYFLPSSPRLAASLLVMLSFVQALLVLIAFVGPALFLPLLLYPLVLLLLGLCLVFGSRDGETGGLLDGDNAWFE